MTVNDEIKPSGFFDVEEWLAQLRVPGDQPEVFSRTVDVKVFHLDPERILLKAGIAKALVLSMIQFWSLNFQKVLCTFCT